MDGYIYYLHLFKKYLSGTALPVETEELKASWQQEADNAVWEKIIGECLAGAAPDMNYHSGHWETMVNVILDRHQQPAVKKRLFPLRWAAAAMLLLVAGLAIYFYSEHKAQNEKNVQAKLLNAAPGKEGAILMLAGGKQVLLDTVQNGVVALQGGAVAKVLNGTLVYEAAGTEVVYNTMSTPRGRQYRLQLPDGTGVWLNSASSVTFPVVFNGPERKVTVTGEVYFEVAHNKAQPFIVTKNNMEVQVLGTHFNVNAYDDEPDIKVTLLEGRIKVRSHSGLDPESSGKQNNPVLLKPGQQATVRHSEPDSASINVISTVDLEQVMAWKNGLFNFEGAGLQEVMRQLERWYDIKVVYEKKVPDMRFGGKINRQATLNDVLGILEKAGVKFRAAANRTLIVQQ